MNAQQLQTWEAEVKYLQDIIDKQEDRIAELEKQNQTLKVGMGLLKGISKMDEDYKKRQSEPVAWMMKHKNKNVNLSFDKFQLETDNTDYCNIPLYTAPHHASDVKQTKLLSDEEIADCGYQLQKPEKWNVITCACGEPFTPNTVHRKNEPCYVKEKLTDDELLSLADKFKENMDHFGNRIGIPEDDFLDFARAIEAKVRGEK